MSHHSSVKKATLLVSGLGGDICSPFFNSSGQLHVLRQNSGAVMSVSSAGAVKTITNTGGQPSGAIFSSNNDHIYVSDLGHGAILAVQPQNQQQDLVVAVYEDKPLRGPNSICIKRTSNNENENNEEGERVEIFFTDSGSFGETGLHARQGRYSAKREKEKRNRNNCKLILSYGLLGNSFSLFFFFKACLRSRTARVVRSCSRSLCTTWHIPRDSPSRRMGDSCMPAVQELCFITYTFFFLV
jgi:hypothetical protein